MHPIMMSWVFGGEVRRFARTAMLRSEAGVGGRQLLKYACEMGESSRSAPVCCRGAATWGYVACGRAARE